MVPWKATHEPEEEVALSVFDSGRHRRFGRYNPELMEVPFWHHMVRGGHGPYRYREQFKVPWTSTPIWTFNRLGGSRTLFEKHGRQWLICIGGEHEDSYDPDFMIYNDVVVRDFEGNVWIYGYPEDAFPPTDFHSATLIDECIYLIGRLGYKDDRDPTVTPVLCLDLEDMSIQKVETSGEVPGWIYEHEAVPSADQTKIVISGGKRINYSYQVEANHAQFELDLVSLRWKRL